MNFKEIISSKTKLFETAKICFTHNKASYFIENLRSVYRNTKLLNEKNFNNLVALDSELENIKGYSRIVEYESYNNYKTIKLKHIKIELERKTAKKIERIEEKKILLERKRKNEEKKLLKNEEKSNNKEKNILKDNSNHKEILKKSERKYLGKYTSNKNHRELLSYIYTNKTLPSFEGFDKSQVNEIFKRLEFNKKMSNEQYLRYKTVQSLFSDLPIKSINEINKLVEAKNKILTKEFFQGTYIVYNRNGK